MRYSTAETSWAKFGKARDFAFVGRDAIAIVSGVYARFVDWRSGATRIERFEGRERGDGASCVAGLSVAPIFSLVERKSNPLISVFAYPSMRRIARCANSSEASGYARCAFAGTEYLLGQTIYPDFRIVLWHWRTGERLAETDATAIGPSVEFRATIACSPNSPLLVARSISTASTSTVSIHRVLGCSKIVRLFPVEASVVSDREPVSVAWTTEGTLLLCDRFGNVESLEIDEHAVGRVRTIVRALREPRRNPVLVAHRGGALLVVASPDESDESDGTIVRATFFRKGPTDRAENNWRTVWTMSLPAYPSRAESHPRDDRIVLLDEDGGTLAIVGPSRDRPPRLESLVEREEGYAAIAPLPFPLVAALSNRGCRLLIFDAATGPILSPTSRSSLNHHGAVTRMVSHPSLPILATCSDTGNCLLIETSTPSVPRVAGCAHLQRESFDRLKFSEDGGLLGVGSSRLGRLFLVWPTAASVAAALNVGRPMVDFLVYGSKSGSEAIALVLIAGSGDRDPRAGREIAVFSCQLDGQFRETALPEHAITFPFLYESLFALRFEGNSGPSDETPILATPYLSNEFHRIEFESRFREATLCDVFPSLHRTRNLEVGLHRDGNSLLTCGYDGAIVVREGANPRRIAAVFLAHHRSEGGTRSAVLLGDRIVSLGRNGDLTSNRIPELDGEPSRVLANEFGISEANADPDSELDDPECESWIERKIRERKLAEEKRVLSTRLSILEDFEKLRRRTKQLLDANEKEPPEARLPIRAFDLDQETRRRKLAAIEAVEAQLSRSYEQRIERYDRATRYLREKFLDPLLVPASSVSSVFTELKVANYPLVRVSPQDQHSLSWCRFSEATRRQVAGLEEELLESAEREKSLERNRFAPCRHGYVQVWEASVLANDRERDAKVRFNRLFEEIRSTKEKEARAAIDCANETRRCVDQLMRTFRVDATAKLLDPSKWYRHRDEERIDREIETATIESESPSSDRAFRRSMLDRTMDGVLQVGLEENANRVVPVPDCLARDKPSRDYTREDVEAIAAYEKKMRALAADRLAYRSTLEAKIERAREEFQARATAFDSRLRELAAEKIRVERSLLLDRLTGAWTVLWHRRVSRHRSEIRRAIQLEVAPAARRTRALAAECELFEAGLVELRNRYETLRKRDKLLDEKFRTDCLDSELLLRQYRKRPRAVSAAAAACGTSLAFLRELGERVLDRRDSDLLPPDWCGYLRALRDLDAMPFRIEPDEWQAACAFRRHKIEAEIKVRSCAVELAEAEQSLAFYRRACSSARAAANRRRESVQRLEKALLELLDDQEIPLSLKTGQLREQPSGRSTSEWAEAVLIPRREIDRVTEAIATTGQRKLSELRRSVNLRRTTSREEWRLACLRRTMQDLRAQLKDLDNAKPRKAAQNPTELSDSKIEKSLQTRRSELEKAVNKQREKSRRIAIETQTWRRRNSRLDLRIDREKLEIDRLTAAVRDDPLRSKAVAFHRRKMHAIRKKANLASVVREICQQLLILESQLEISKLRTYPTLTTRLEI